MNRYDKTSLRPFSWPWARLLRGDIAYGNESVLAAAEARNQPYLTKLRLTPNVKRLITRLFAHTDWEKAGQGWEGR
ncbi:MAG: hypothetical protein ACYDEV_17725, partial [Acidiferrobacter sp.]